MYLGQEMWQNMKVKQRCALLSLLDELKKRLRNKVIFLELKKVWLRYCSLAVEQNIYIPLEFFLYLWN